MDWAVIDGFNDKELEFFRTACNHLLGRTFVTRIAYGDGEKKHNPEYTFIAQYQQLVHDYLALAGWELFQDQYNGYFYVQNDLEENRLTMDKDTTGMLLALRLIYDENSERAGLNQDVICYVRELLEKTVTDFAILKQKPNMRDIRKSLQLMEKHCIIAKLDGRFNEMGCRFTILPTILTAVSTEKLNILVERMKISDEDSVNEETDEDAFD
jgi:hypothetical protein